MISVIIATKNRPQHLFKCLTSLSKSSYRNFETIVVYQGSVDVPDLECKAFSVPSIRHIVARAGGKARALNAGIRIARGEILAFTDDDCIVDTSWLATIERSLTQHTSVTAVFGKTLPYKPHGHDGLICPCTFSKTESVTITQPALHSKYIGFGNNMAIRTSIYKSVGMFKEWLGPGSIGSNAEDAEFALRLLICGKKIAYNPKSIVYHNKWLTPKEMFRQNLSYCCGEMACYSYFHFQGQRFATSIVSGNGIDSYRKMKANLKNLLLFRWGGDSVRAFAATGVEVWYRLRGLIVGYIYTLIDPIGCVPS